MSERPTDGWLYTVRERFTPDRGDGLEWDGYLASSGFSHIDELISLDGLLCPDVVDELRDADWKHNVDEDFRTTLFRDAEYLSRRQPLDPSAHQLLAVLERPSAEEEIPAGFEMCGYDIMDSYIGNSTLTNCGRIPEAFAPADVNQYGLFAERDAAMAARDRMRELEPNDSHLGECEVWLIARRPLNGSASHSPQQVP